MASKDAPNKAKPVSCAECRRLKLKCERQFPCSNCIRRGLQGICPEGSLPTRPKVLMDQAERLTQENAELTERLHLLEEALQSLRRKRSPTAQANQGTDPTIPDLEVEKEDEEADFDEINDTLGTLTIDEEGRSMFLGNTAGMESIFRANEVTNPDKPTVPFPNILHTLGLFSSLHDSEETVFAQIEVYLPPASAAHQLIDIYYERAAWFFSPMPRVSLFTLVFPHIYSPRKPTGSLTFSSSPTLTPANVACLFMIFAIGSLLSYDPGNGDNLITGQLNETYHQLARTALSCESVLASPSIENIRALALMAYYHLLRDQNAAQHVWGLLGLASHMAGNIGLHRDPKKWQMDEQTMNDRRALFWEIYFLCTLQSIGLGRPPPLSLDFCDCEHPRVDEPVQHHAGEFSPPFAPRKYRFASSCLAHVIRITLTVKRLSYTTVLAVDRKIRDHHTLKIEANGATGTQGMELGAATVELTLQRFMTKAMGEMALLYLHRRFFARALSDHPNDILHCPFGPSVVAIFRAASAYITLMRDLCAFQAELATKFAIFWNNLLSSSFVMAAIVTRCPSSVLAQSAFAELEACNSLLTSIAEVAGPGSRPAKALDIVSKILRKAQNVISNMQAGMPTPVHASSSSSRKGRGVAGKEDIYDAVDILSGRPRLLTTKRSDPQVISNQHHQSSIPKPVARNEDLKEAERIYAAYKAAHPDLVKHFREATVSPPTTLQLPNVAQPMEDVVDSPPEPMPVTPPIVQQPSQRQSQRPPPQPQPQGRSRLQMSNNLKLDPTLFAFTPDVTFTPFAMPPSQPASTHVTPFPTPYALDDDMRNQFAPVWDLSPPTADFTSVGVTSYFDLPVKTNAGWPEMMKQFGMPSV